MKVIKKYVCSIVISLVTIVLFSSEVLTVKAAYNYDADGKVITSAESIVATHVIDVSNLKDTNGNLVSNLENGYQLGELVDVDTFENRIYLVDNLNNKIAVLDENYNLITVFPNDESEDKLKQPKGIFVTDTYIYVCDYGNERVAIFNHQYTLVQEVYAPEDTAFKDYKFRPKKIAVNRTGRMYVIAEGINEGIIDFNPDGTFSRYYGMNSTNISGWAAFWRLFTSERQRAVQGFNFGKSLINLCIDSDEYVYTVSAFDKGSSTNVIKRLNYKGSDILTRNGYVPQIGDIEIIDGSDKTVSVPTGNSHFVDIDVNDYGTYIALDQTRGRIFGYDFEGNLLYVAGELATATSGITNSQKSKFLKPEALCYFGDKILVVDSQGKNMIVFEFTTFGNLVNQATSLYYNDEYALAAEVWKEVLALNSNYYLGYSGIGKAQLREGKYKEAMKNLKLGNDKYNYSRAYEQYRYEKMSKILPYIIGIVLIGGFDWLGYSIYKSIKKNQKEE